MTGRSFILIYRIHLESNRLEDSLVALGLKYSQTLDAFNQMLLALTQTWFKNENNRCQTSSTDTSFCQISETMVKQIGRCLCEQTTFGMCKCSCNACVLTVCFSSFLASAVIVTHLCTASTFFTLLSWLPTFFKDTFPDAKVNTVPFHHPLDHIFDLKITRGHEA